MRRTLRLALLGLSALSAPAFGYDVVGPNKCTNCHDHDPQKDWYYKGEGNKGHRKSLEQLEEPKGKEYAKKLGLSDDAVYSAKGRCVVCHATVVKGKDPEIGVSCETCHGAGSGYLEPHKEKNSYKQAVSLGMFDTRVKESGDKAYANWAKICLDCHVLPARDKDLVAAGHSSGADFKLKEKSFGQVVHWKEKYDPDALAKAAPAVAPVGGGKPAAPAPSKPEPAKPEPAKPEPVKPAPAPEPTKAGPAAPAPKAEPTRASAAPAPAPKGEGPKPAAPAAPPPAAPTEAPALAPAPVPIPAPGPVATPPPPATGVVPQLAGARGRVLTELSTAVKAGKTLPKPVPAALPSLRYAGPEGELLRLQEEVLALELEALAPAATPAAPKKEK